MFTAEDGTRNPVESWEHLLFDGPELSERLVRRGVPARDAAAIVEYIFESDLINRYSADYLERCMRESNLTVVECVRGEHARPKPHILDRLLSRHSVAESEFWTNEVRFLLQKPAS